MTCNHPFLQQQDSCLIDKKKGRPRYQTTNGSHEKDAHYKGVV
jgi:hypothetical protein